MTDRPKEKRSPLIVTIQQAKRLIVLVIGLTVLMLGVVMLLLPGPGIVTIVAGLAILATEFVWARKLLKRFKDGANNLKNSIFSNSTKT